LGADPEVFVRDLSTGNIVPVCGWLGGSKGLPASLGNPDDKLFVQEDGITAEFNIPPTTNFESFTLSIANAMLALVTRVRAQNPEYGLLTAGYVTMSRDELSAYPQAYMLGCSPEFDAYAEGAQVPRVQVEQLVVPDTNGELEYRFAGGHLHIGASYKGVYALEIPKYVLAAFCDVFIGLKCVEADRQGVRRSFYGQAGRFRPTKYGIEYRTLSNFWTSRQTRTARVATSAFNMLDTLIGLPIASVMNLFDAIPWGAVRDAINTEDAQAAFDLMQHSSTLLDNMREAA
jgi:hypothetical protein